MAKQTDALPHLERLFHILYLVQTRRHNHPLRRKELAEACQCSSQTIQRDMAFLVRCQIGIHYERSIKAYVVPEKGLPFFAPQFTLIDTIALALARGVLSAPGMPYREEVHAALGKVTDGLNPPLRRLLDAATQAIGTAPLPRDYSDAPIESLSRACGRRETLEVEYSSFSSGTRKWRRIDPYQIAAREGVFWEMHGWCHQNQSVRTFALDKRFHGVRATGDRFVVRQPEWEAFQNEKAIGGLRGGREGTLSVDVRFTPTAAPYALVRQWPEGLAITNEADGTARLTGTVASGRDPLLTELLRWRRHVEVLGGPELRARIADEVHEIAAVYAGPGSSAKT